MNTNNFLDRLCNIDSNLSQLEIINGMAAVEKSDIDNLIEKMCEDVDIQTAVDYHLKIGFPEEVLNGKNFNKNIKTKVCILRKAIDEFLKSINTGENPDSSTENNDTSDVVARYTALEILLNQNSKKIESLNNEHQQLHKDIENATETLNKAEKSLRKTTTQTKSILSQSIEILGIFVAIIAIFIGGFAEISLFGTIPNLNTYKFFLYVVITGHIMSDLIFMFCYMLGRITSKSIAVTCGHYRCIPNSPDEDVLSVDKCQICCYNTTETCKNLETTHCTMFEKLKNKYPYVYFINLIMIAAELLLCIGWLFGNNILDIRSNLSAKIIILAVLILVFAGVIFYKPFKRFLQKSKNKS